tara:strand:+ start:1347 stop:1958 length:612 start_codon:yes stop_codon:yes gene_type:complete
LSNYYTIQSKSDGKHQIKGSKYYGFAYPIINLNEIKFHLNNLKKSYSDASHICYAYRLKNQNNIEDFSTDAGEPRGSAGLPILNALKRENVINVVVFIVRYFGGSKLGIPGLIESYGKTAENTLNNSKLVNYIPLITIEISFEIKYNSRIEAAIEKYNGIAIHKDFFSKMIYSISLPEKQKIHFLREINNICNGRIKIINNSF